MSSTPNTPPNAPKEMSSEIRMLLFFVLAGVILFGSNWLYRRMGLVPEATTQNAAKSAGSSGAKASTGGAATAAPAKPAAESTNAAPASTPAAPATPIAPVAASAKQTIVIDTDVYHVELSNEGAVVQTWLLKKYKDAKGRPLQLVNQVGAAKAGYPLAIQFRGEANSPINKALWEAHPSADGLTVEFEYSDGHLSAKKTLAFTRSTYLVQIADEVRRDGAGVPHEISWRAGFGDMDVTNASAQVSSIRYDVAQDKLIRDAVKTAKNGPVYTDGTFSFFGLEDRYFVAAFLPPAGSPIKTTLFDDNVATAFNTREDQFAGIAIGGEARNQLSLYVGPKEGEVLASVNPNLSHVIDWGWFRILAQPLFILLRELNDRLIHNYGWAIIVLTLIINTALFPLKIMNLKSMRKMQLVQPQINKINEKYKGIGMSDPRSQQKQAEIMELYKKHGINPMGGCIPMLIQLPFLYAFYKVLSVSVEMRHAPWLWVSDLTQPEHFGIHFLPLIMIVTSVVLQKMTPTPAGGDPNQQKMMQFMPVMMGIFFWSLSSGVVLYYLTSNLVGVAQQWFFNKTAAPLPVTTVIKDGRKKA
ncbi:MAG TPA: membrane protein insertase YidC [Bryobacteraceae bacterium]|nr:membrane protein insertase YidC [Bryobacteraceae bacterium]